MIRTPIDRYGGALAPIRPDTLASVVISSLTAAIALGHPLGMSGARLVATAVVELEHRRTRRALTTMCIGVGQGIAMVLERV